jgi:selenocysteine-specific elongation factor
MAARPSGPAASTRLAVVGTAGHIDHGKTALVRRLTGVDTDRLPEEKRRGISIDLGFARLVTPRGSHVGIVDVPGHERFVKNMLAGVGGIDVVLLVIAADEGPMPQTREHLAIVSLLGVKRGVVVLAKADLVEREWLDLVRRDVTALLADTPLRGAPVVEFSAVTGQGEAELLAALDEQLAGVPGRDLTGPARLPVDRVFTAEGFGTVVTGTLWRGAVRTGDTLALLPEGRAVRVRRVQVHGETVEQAQAGQRTALALHGVERAEVERGDWLATPESLVPSQVLDVRFELLPDFPREWPALARVRFHLGASEIIGRLALLEGEVLGPGSSALAQVRLEKPTVAARDDRFVIRSYSPSRTVGGGSVIQPVARKRRRHAELEAIALMEKGSVAQRAAQTMALWAGPGTPASLARALGAAEGEARAALAELEARAEVVRVGEGAWVTATRWQAALGAIQDEVAAYARRHPARFGVPKGELKAKLQTSLDAMLFDAALASLMEQRRLAARADRLRPEAEPWSPPAEVTRALEAVVRDLEASGLSVPESAQWTAKLGPLGVEVAALGQFLGRLVRVTQEFTYTRGQLEGLRRRLVGHFAAHPSLTVADFKGLAGVTRKHAVPLLEQGDRVGWTARVGDERRPGPALQRPLPEAEGV